jgi:hypothetical protein
MQPSCRVMPWLLMTWPLAQYIKQVGAEGHGAKMHGRAK